MLGRKELFRSSPLPRREREQFFGAFLHVCEWVKIYYSWRPNLADEADNHIIELAVAGAADAIITRNVRDLCTAELRFPDIRIVTPDKMVEELL